MHLNPALVATSADSRSDKSAWRLGAPLRCVETQSREIMARLVHDVLADAMRLGLHDKMDDEQTVSGGPHHPGRDGAQNG